MKLPQLNLRDLFWLVLVCALAVGWWLERSRTEARVDAAEARAAFYRSGAVTAGVDFSDN